MLTNVWKSTNQHTRLSFHISHTFQGNENKDHAKANSFKVECSPPSPKCMEVNSTNCSVMTLLLCVISNNMRILRSRTSKEKRLCLLTIDIIIPHLPTYNSLFPWFCGNRLSIIKFWCKKWCLWLRNTVLLGYWLCFLCRIFFQYNFVIYIYFLPVPIYSHLQHLIIKKIFWEILFYNFFKLVSYPKIFYVLLLLLLSHFSHVRLCAIP